MTDVRAVPTVQIDEAAVRVSEWRLAPGAVIDWHRHEYPYVVVPMTTGRLASKGRHGEITTELVAGRCYSRPEGVEHEVRNANPFEFVFIEIEIKRRT
jgi:beta-alanine degradation protein BauB